MYFGLSEDQTLFQDSLTRYLAEASPPEVVRGAAEAETSGDAWAATEVLRRGLADMGAFGILIPEHYGGAGLGVLDAALVAETLGGAAAPVPFTAMAVMAPLALMLTGSDEQKERWLPRCAAGEAYIGVGVTETFGRRDGGGLTAASDETLTGSAYFVLDGVNADAFIVADTGGQFYLIEAGAAGLEITPQITIDRTRGFCSLSCTATPASRLPGNAPLHNMIAAGRVVLAADTLGAAQTMLDKAVDYAGEREQFGRIISSFQSVKHLCAEMAAEIEPLRSLVWYAAHARDAVTRDDGDDGNHDAQIAAAHAKALSGEAGRFVARTATEVHGGIGFTDLLGLHFWFKRIGANRQLLGGPEQVREEAARLQGWLAA
ncbi:MAG: acyl-CoA dehydrogenase family protein [Parvularculales bacterium]